MRLNTQHIPKALLEPALFAAPSYDLHIEAGHIKSIRANDAPPSATLISCPVDIHVHLDKTGVVQRTGAACGDLHRAIELMAAERDAFTAQDVHARTQAALQAAHAAGTRAMRTHLDWMQPEPPVSLLVFEALREAWRRRITMQAVCLTPLDFFADDHMAAAEALVRNVAAAHARADSTQGEAVLMGAFVWMNEDLPGKLHRLFSLCQAHGLDVDLHIDEGLDPRADGLRVAAELVQRMGFQGRVTCGHVCSLSVQPKAEALATLRSVAAANIALVGLPTTNAYLQGAWTETPLERGIFRINEASALDIPTCIATDNVADAFFPYGSYDLLDTFAFGVQLAHLHPADEWLASITTHPARVMGLPWDGVLREGAPAHLLQFKATNAFELITPVGRERRVMRRGEWVRKV